jgi:hypothetical protein
MLDLGRSRDLVVFCGVEKCMLDSKPLNIFYKNSFFVCDRYVKILESQQQGRTVFTFYLRCYPERINEYIDIFISKCGPRSSGLYTLNADGTRRIMNFVVRLLEYINDDIDTPYAERLEHIRTFWLSEGYHFHKSVFKFLVTLYVLKPVRVQPYTQLYNWGYGSFDR